MRSSIDASSPVRIRLNSTAVRVKHLGDATSAKEVEVSLRARRQGLHGQGKEFDPGLLACRDPVHLRGTSGQAERGARLRPKVPLLYTNVALRNWTAFQKLGANAVYAPGCYHTRVDLDLAVNIGGYECARKPEEPIVVHMMKTPCQPGLPGA